MNSEKISFVIQGPYVITPCGQSTDDLFKQIYQAFPRSEIIFSSWNEQINELSFVKYVRSTDPGEIENEVIFLKNFKRMMTSTYNGIQASTRTIVVKLRSDSLYKPELANRLRKLINAYNEQKLLVAMHSMPMNPFMLDDKIQIGTKKLLSIFWNIDSLQNLIELAHIKVEKSLQKQVYPTNHMIMSPEQILFLRYTGININSIEGGYSCNFYYMDSMRSTLKFINAPYYGFGSLKWHYVDNIFLRIYLIMMNCLNINVVASIIYLKNNLMPVLKALKLKKRDYNA